MNWASLFETLMIVCFGLSWPLSIVRTLRTKLGAAGAYIETVRGVGYRMGGNA